MAVSHLGNKIIATGTGAVTTDRVRVAYILFCPDAANDEVGIKEQSSDTIEILHFHGATAKQTTMYDFSANPLVFNNGIYVSTLSTGAKIMFITTNQGKG